MGFFKEIEFTIQTTKQDVLTFHDIVGISWSKGTAVILVTVGSWKSKEEFAQDLPYEKTTNITFTGAKEFQHVAKIVDSLVNSPDSIFNGGVPENG